MALNDAAAFWKFNDTLTDASGNGRDLTASGSDYTTGILGNALRSPTTSDFALLSGQLAVSSGNISMGGSFYVADLAVTGSLLVQGTFSGGTSQRINISAGVPSFVVSGGTITSGTTISLVGWNHIVGTHDGTDARLYLNGVLVAGPTTLANSYAAAQQVVRVLAVNALSATPAIGNNFRAENNFFYPREISSAEVSQLYNGGAGYDPYPDLAQQTHSGTGRPPNP